MFTRNTHILPLHQPLAPKWFAGYDKLVFQHVPPAGPAGAPQENAPANPRQAQQAQAVQAQAAMTHEEIAEILTSSDIDRRYSPEALQNALFRGITKSPEQCITELRELVTLYGGSPDTGTLVGSLARTYEGIAVADSGKATEFLYSISAILGKNGPNQQKYQRAHPGVVETITKQMMVQRLDQDFEAGNLADMAVTTTDIAAVSLAFGETSAAARNIRARLINEKVDALLANPEYRSYVVSHEAKLRHDYAKTSRKMLESTGHLPAELARELQALPSMTFGNFVNHLSTVEDSKGLLLRMKQRKEHEVIKVMEEYKEVMNDAMQRELRGTTITLSAEEIMEQCKIETGSIIQMTAPTGQTSLVQVQAMKNRFETAGAPPVREDALIKLKAGGQLEEFTGQEFMKLWKESNASVVEKTPITRAAFMAANKVPEQMQKSSQLFVMVKDVPTYPLKRISEEGLEFGGKRITWTEFQAFLKLKKVNPDEMSFVDKLSKNEEKKAEAANPSGRRKRFWDVWRSTFATPANMVHMAKNVFGYFKDEWEAKEKSRGYEVLHKLLPTGIFKDEIEAKLASIQDEQTQSKLSVISKRTSYQVATSGFHVFNNARKGKPVEDSLLKAYLLALLAKGGDLYYGPELTPKRNTFFIYEALGGKIGDDVYNTLWESEKKLQGNPNLAHPSEWRCIMNYMEKHKERFGPIFYDTYDSAYNAAKDPQMAKQKAQLQDVNHKPTFKMLQLNEVYGHRSWRWIEGIKSTIGREQGVETVFEVFFHALAFGQNLEDKQRKELKNYGIPTHMPFLGYFENAKTTKEGMDMMTQTIQYLASLQKYSGKTTVKGVDLKNFDYSTFCIPGAIKDSEQLKKNRAVLSEIYALMGEDIFKMMAGQDTFKILTVGSKSAKATKAFDNHKTLIQKYLQEYDGKGDYDSSTHQGFNIFFSNPNARGDVGVVNVLMEASQLSGSLVLRGRAKGEAYVENLLGQLQKMYGVITDPEQIDPVTEERYTPAERQALAKHYELIKEDIMNMWVKRMDKGTYDIFLKDPKKYAQRLVTLGYDLPASWEELQGESAPAAPAGQVLANAPVAVPQARAQRRTG